ncbi:MAG TPA: hypothetical protein DDX93_04625 [Smithella sp.]|nr:hypothetical protein [Smithella sp.]
MKIDQTFYVKKHFVKQNSRLFNGYYILDIQEGAFYTPTVDFGIYKVVNCCYILKWLEIMAARLLKYILEKKGNNICL